MFKKAPLLPSQPRRAHTRLSTGKAAGALARGAYTGVREHVKGPRTQLATFFNILLGYGLTIGHPKRKITLDGTEENHMSPAPMQNPMPSCPHALFLWGPFPFALP